MGWALSNAAMAEELHGIEEALDLKQRLLDQMTQGGEDIEVPYTLHTTLYTLHPAPYTLHSAPYTLHTTHYPPHPTPYTLDPAF